MERDRLGIDLRGLTVVPTNYSVADPFSELLLEALIKKKKDATTSGCSLTAFT
jgi:hypothetical protein